MSKIFLCWHLPDGTAERAEEIAADNAGEAAIAFAETFFHENEGEWLGGQIKVQELNDNLDGLGDPLIFAIDIDLTQEDLLVTANLC